MLLKRPLLPLPNLMALKSIGSFYGVNAEVLLLNNAGQ